MTHFPRNFVLTLAALSIGLMIPVWCLLAHGWPTWGDYILRGLLLSETSKQVWGGDLYPRWLVDANDGLGSPVMLFQPMFSYYFSLPLQPLASLDPNGFGRLLILISLFLFMGGLGCYAWLRDYFDERTARLGAILYLTFPFIFTWAMAVMAQHIVLAYAIFPWLLFVAARMVSNPLRYGGTYALLQAALAMISLWATIVFSAVPLGYVLCASPRERRWKNIAAAFFAAALGLLLAAIYWLPVIMNRDFIVYSDFISGGHDYRKNFLSLTPKAPGDAAAQDLRVLWLECGLTLLPLLAACLQLKFRELFAVRRKECLFFAAVIAGACFMCFPVSKPLWDMLGFLQNVQTPTKFLLATPPAIIFLMCCWLPRLGGFWPYHIASAAALLLAVTTSAGCCYQASPDFYHAPILKHRWIAEVQHETVWMKNAGIIDPANPPPRFRNVPPSRVINGQARITELTQASRSIRFHASVTSAMAEVALKRYYYPGWAVLSGMPGVAITQHDALLALDLPRGDYDVTLNQPWFPGEKTAAFMSLDGLALLLVWRVIRLRSIKIR